MESVTDAERATKQQKKEADMISKKMQKAINEQINRELYSSYLYLAMSAWAELQGYKGAGTWMAVQAQEENGHAMKFFRYLLDQGATVELAAIQKPPTEFKSLASVFEETLKHEKFVTSCIHDLMTLAKAEKDYASEILIQWFVTEQVEEEASAAEILGQIKMAERSPGVLLAIDRGLGQRKAD